MGTLTYLPTSSPQVQADRSGQSLFLKDFVSGAPNVVTENSQIFLSQVNVPTEQFSTGFPDASGKLLTDNNGNPLIEYFSLHLQSTLMLNENEAEGDYQLAVMSDDGSILQIDENGTGQFQEWINLDGDRCNTFGCASKTVHLVPGLPLPIKLDYFQGPRYGISLLMLWRKITPGMSLSDPECYNTSVCDDYYFDFNQSPPPALQPWQSLLNRGWSVIPATNFYLPGTITNPCAKPSGTP